MGDTTLSELIATTEALTVTEAHASLQELREVQLLKNQVGILAALDTWMRVRETPVTPPPPPLLTTPPVTPPPSTDDANGE